MLRSLKWVCHLTLRLTGCSRHWTFSGVLSLHCWHLQMESDLSGVHSSATTAAASLQSTVSWLSPGRRLSQRPPDSGTERDEVAQAFKPWLPAMFGTVASTGGQSDQVRPSQACLHMLEPAVEHKCCSACAPPRVTSSTARLTRDSSTFSLTSAQQRYHGAATPSAWLRGYPSPCS